jgi:diamine N-acetyltransferase
MNSRLHVQKAVGRADIEMLEALAKEIWDQNYSPVIGKTNVDYMIRFQSKTAIESDIMSGFVYFIAFYDNVPCGYSSIKKDGPEVFISKMHVKQGYRGRGVTRAMLNEIFEYAKKCKAEKVWLNCSRYNASSLELYEKSGFTIMDSGITGNSQRPSYDEYVLEKKI